MKDNNNTNTDINTSTNTSIGGFNKGKPSYTPPKSEVSNFLENLGSSDTTKDEVSKESLLKSNATHSDKHNIKRILGEGREAPVNEIINTEDLNIESHSSQLIDSNFDDDLREDLITDDTSQAVYARAFLLEDVRTLKKVVTSMSIVQLRRAHDLIQKWNSK